MDFLTIGIVISSLIIIGLVLIQQRESGVGGVFGGGESGGFYQRRRGLEKMVFLGTIVFAVIFAVLSILKLVY